MNIYLINAADTANFSGLSQFNLVDLTNITVDDLSYSLDINFSYREKKFGIKLSAFELQLYLKHYAAWTHFKNTGDPYCLVMENVDKIIESEGQITRRINNFPGDCDIFFPYDGFNRATPRYQITYPAGFRWGADAYFLSRNAAEVLLSINRVKQPVEDEILELWGLEKLNIYYEDTPIFSYRSDAVYKADRNKMITDAVLALNTWSEEDEDKVRNLIGIIFNLASEAGIELFLSDGTLLGHIRHGGIMGWDDDIDFSLDIEDLDIFLNLLKENTHLNICKWYWGREGALYYKIWDDSGTAIPRKRYKFPFVDVWLYQKRGETLRYNYGAEYPLSAIFPLQPARFEQSSVYIPFDPLNYLDIKYKDWRGIIQVFPLRHRTESIELIPLRAEIETDIHGMIK